MKHHISQYKTIYGTFVFILFLLLTTLFPQAQTSSTLESSTNKDINSKNQVEITCEGGNFNNCKYKTIKSSGLLDQSKTQTLSIDSNGQITQKITKQPTGDIADMLRALNSIFTGYSQVTFDSETQAISRIESSPGIVENVTALNGHLYVPVVEPATHQVYALYKEVTNKLNPVESVYAQESTVYNPGLGSEILQPIRSFWSMNRNIAYGFQIIIVFIIAMMLLFRQKLNGQQVISLMNALPSIVLSIILISFSYGLSGLFIDVITLGSNLAQSVLISAPGSPGYSTFWQENTYIKWDEGNLLTQLYNRGTSIVTSTTSVTGPDSYKDEYFAKTSIQIDDPLMSIWLIFGTANMNINPEDITTTNILPDAEVIQTRSYIGGIVNSFSGFLDSPLGEGVVGGLGSQLLRLIFAFAAFMASLKIFFALLKEWLTLIVFPIISPFLFLFAALPTMTGKMLTLYFQTMASASLSFVAVYAVFLFILVIGHAPTMEGLSFLPPLLGYSTSTTVTTTAGVVRVLIGYGLYLSVPLIPDAVKQFVSSGTADIFGKAGGEVMKGTSGSAMQFLGIANNIVNSIKKKSFPE